MVLAGWRYTWRTSPLHRRDETGSRSDLGPALPPGVSGDDLQPAEVGVGAFFRRRYEVRIEGSDLTPEELLSRVAEDPNRAAPAEVAVFRKSSGEAGDLRVGDEFLIRMPGPWNGPVRVIDRTPTSFRFVTLRGHLEAGQIEFRASRGDGGALRFEIESWARSGDRLSDLLYDRFHISKEMQLHMWSHVCERTAKIAGGRVRGGITIETRRVEAAFDGT